MSRGKTSGKGPRDRREGAGVHHRSAGRRPTGEPHRPDPERRPPARLSAPADGRYWIYGRHAVLAALANPRRRSVRLLVTAEAEAEHGALIAAARARLGERLAVARAERREIGERLGGEPVHQGLALETLALDPPELDAVIAEAGAEATLLVLDQVTDPHNVGAILRSAAAFGCAGVVATHHHAPPETGVMAKAASGGLEQVPLLRVGNLVQALQALKRAGFWCLGLSAEGSQPLASADLSGRIAFVLGSEGAGLRRLTREHCDLLVRLPTRGGLVQLNVSNAAALALYERTRSAPPAIIGEPDEA